MDRRQFLAGLLAGAAAAPLIGLPLPKPPPLPKPEAGTYTYKYTYYMEPVTIYWTDRVEAGPKYEQQLEYLDLKRKAALLRMKHNVGPRFKDGHVTLSPFVPMISGGIHGDIQWYRWTDAPSSAGASYVLPSWEEA